MAKQIKKGKELRQLLKNGVEQLAETVTITLGPQGRNVGIENTWTNPTVIHDGVKVAKEIELPNPFENFGAQLVQQASAKTADKAGDGTTTSTLLAYEMIKRGYEYIEGNTNPMHLKRGMQLVLGELLKILQTKSKSVTTEQQIQQVATISAADGDMGNIIGSAIHKIGKDGVINVSEYEGFNLEVEYKEGMEIDKGYVSAHFATEENGEAIIESPHILLTDMLISSPDELAKFLKRYTEETKRAEIVIIATDVVGTAMSTLLLNKIRGGIIPLACLAPGIGPRRVEILEDIATLTGGKVLYKDGSHTLENVPLDVLGRADRVIADKDKTRIVGGFGASEDITKRADTIREQIKKTTSDFEKSKLQERLARLVSGAAIIKVGALTEVELSDRKERVIDAVEATKAAVAEGIVAGGGVTFLALQDSIATNMPKANNVDEQKGMDIVIESLSSPINKLLSNAGIDSGVIEKINPSKNYGINIINEQFGDMFEMGIIDPTRVIKEALQNAVSVAAMLLTTEAVIVKIKEKTKPETSSE